jgi:RNA polymerase sigma-70 factor (ECF subfamily)
MDAPGPELLTRLLGEHGAALVLYAQQWCNAPEDVVQEALVRLMRQRPVPENVVGWLYRVVRNGAISASRSAARRARHESAAAAGVEPWFTTTCGERIDASAAATALQSLPIEQRETIVARLWGGLPFEQIAELTGTSTSTAHRRYAAGLEALRERLGVPCLDRESRER